MTNQLNETRIKKLAHKTVVVAERKFQSSKLTGNYDCTIHSIIGFSIASGSGKSAKEAYKSAYSEWRKGRANS